MQVRDKRVFVIGGNYGVELIFRNKSAVIVDNLDEADIVVWTGGSDVSPEFYNERQHPKTNTDPRRDKWEKACYQRAQSKRKVCIGICRGGQFLNVMNGGTLWQHVDNHAIRGEHPMLFETPVTPSQTVISKVMVTSTHHQMIIPNSRAPGKEVWGRSGESTKKSSGCLLNEGKGPLFEIVPAQGHMSDCEIVFYPRTKSLCFQPHPEYNSKSTHDLFFTCVERALAA